MDSTNSYYYYYQDFITLRNALRCKKDKNQITEYYVFYVEVTISSFSTEMNHHHCSKSSNTLTLLIATYTRSQPNPFTSS